MGESGHESGDRERLKGVAVQGAASMVQHYGSSIRSDKCQHKNVQGHMLEAIMVIDLFLGLFRGAVFHCGGLPKNNPFNDQPCWAASLSLKGCFPPLVGHFPSLMGRFPPLMGRFHEYLNGPLSLPKIHLH